jgi:hypothetical protein
VKFLKIAIDEVMKKLDSVCCDSISPDADEKTLLDIREKAVWPTLLPNTLKRSKQLLLEIWKVKRTSPDITFDEALEIFQKMSALGVPQDEVLLKKYWRLVCEKASGKKDYKKMACSCSSKKYCDDAISLWILWNATFEELVAYQKETRSDSKVLRSAIIKGADTLEKAVSLIEYTPNDEYAQQIAENISAKIGSFKQGLLVLKTKYMPCQRTILIRGAIRYVTDETELEIVIRFITENRYLTKEDKVILVEKALELFGTEVEEPERSETETKPK